MITEKALGADDPVPSRTGPIEDSAWAALGHLRQAYICAQDAGADLWDFALEIGGLFDAGLTISALRWLVARGFAEHGQELSAYGGSHRLFRRGEGFFFEPTTCVVLTPDGAAFVEQFRKGPGVSLHVFPPPETAPLPGGPAAARENGSPADSRFKGTTAGAIKPCWDAARRELRLRGTVIKRFRVPAPIQERILEAFEEEGWPEHIDDPLPVCEDIDPPTRLHDAINRLNGRQLHRLIRFSGNGAGTGISWAFRRAGGVRRPDRRREIVG
jgi:hypothetical protein